MNFSQLTSALISTRAELAPAIANINLDLALCKIDAPEEYKAIGKALSAKRRENAEDGPIHSTARRLGALFEQTLPETPALFRAYGRRASEISASTSDGDPAKRSYGAFASSAGVDAASLWAAATSGRGAIAVHLLACILARIWDGAEATSIWVEIVKHRQQQILAQLERDSVGHVTSYLAARQDITRAQIREWDASARAWLRAADIAKERQQKQLMLIINNLDAQVNNRPDVFGSVMDVWKTSLQQMELLVKGTAQHANGGSILLALSSWHLYPNMTILKPVSRDISPNDSLISSMGILTIGMEPPSTTSPGLRWTLPLSHLRRYGKPVEATRYFDISSSSRLSGDDFLIAFLGCFLSLWRETTHNTDSYIRWLIWLADVMERGAVSEGPVGEMSRAMLTPFEHASWLSVLFDAAKLYERRFHASDPFASKLLLIGQEYGPQFLGRPLSQPLFGLTHLGSFVSVMKHERARVAYLRKLAEDLWSEFGCDPNRELGPGHFLIRYVRADGAIEFASALPCVPSRKRNFDGDPILRYYRFVDDGQVVRERTHYEYENFCRRRETWQIEQFGMPLSADRYSQEPESFKSYLLDAYFDRKQDFEFANEVVIPFSQLLHDDLYPNIGVCVYPSNTENFAAWASDFGLEWPYLSDALPFEFLHGDPCTAALYQLCCDQREPGYDFLPHGYDEPGVGNHAIADETIFHEANEFSRISQSLYSYAQKNKFDDGLLIKYMDSHFRNIGPCDAAVALRGISTAAQLYRGMKDASIDIRVLKKPLYKAEWIFDARGQKPYGRETCGFRTPLVLRPYLLHRSSGFACILMFETGIFNISPSDLSRVFAISTPNSLIVGSHLLDDPSEKNSEGIRHIAGHIGREGIALLVPPKDPIVKDFNLSDWRDGPSLRRDLLETDCFKNTTLHISFTGAEQAVNVGFSGQQDSEVYLLETLVQVYDRGAWVADLNVYEAMRSLYYIPPCPPSLVCKEGSCVKTQFASIDTWTGVLGAKRSHPNVVHAKGNWQARLASSVVCQMLGYETWVASDSICWDCLDLYREGLQSDFAPVVIIS